MKAFLRQFWPYLLVGGLFALLAVLTLLARRRPDGWAHRARVSVLAAAVALMAGPFVSGCETDGSNSADAHNPDTNVHGTCYADVGWDAPAPDSGPTPPPDVSGTCYADVGWDVPEPDSGPPPTPDVPDVGVMCYVDPGSLPDATEDPGA